MPVDRILFQTFQTLQTRLFWIHYQKTWQIIADNSPVQNYTNKIKNRIVFRIKTGYKPELSSEKISYYDVQKEMLIKIKMEKMCQKLESVEVVLAHCNSVNNNYQPASKVLFTFVPKKQFGQLITLAPHSLTTLNTTNTEFSSIAVWFTDQNSKLLKSKIMLIWH